MKIARDKKIHFAVCLVAAACAAYISVLMKGCILASLWAGLAAAMGLGIGKEYGDSKSPGNKWDWHDILADFTGAAIGCMTAFIPNPF